MSAFQKRVVAAVAMASCAHRSLASKMAKMDCGEGVPLCGTLTLQTGLGSGVYHSTVAKVHGLWPEVGEYGTSKCVKPVDASGPKKIYDCYARDPSDQHALWFENHEWSKHGTCAGAKNVDDFFEQVCSLSNEPLQVLEKAKETGESFEAMASALKDAKYPVWRLDELHDQVELSACAGADGRWVLAEMSEMPAKCGGFSPGPHPSPQPPSPSPAPVPHSGVCLPGRKGPACNSDSDCAQLKGCARCAHSGFCTDQPLVSVHV